MIMNPITIHSLKTAVLTGIPRVAWMIQAEVLQVDIQEATDREETFLTEITRLAGIMIVNPITIANIVNPTTIAARIINPINIAPGIMEVNPMSIGNTTQLHRNDSSRNSSKDSNRRHRPY
eukprot:GHVP01013626.1.p1 GENE.GHVP01013626.1~~GHVP01013626.1.p1  ORF type:complete len:121 (-),score=6.29 GHVP01013626.1:31-393(-)